MNKIPWLLGTLLCVFTALNVRAGDTIHTRGWIGGEFALAKKARLFHGRHTVHSFPASLRKEQKAGIFVRFVPPGSPSAQAGLQAGDLILKLNDQPVESLRGFHDPIEALPPGHAIQLTVWRAGEKRQLNAVTGRETYRKVGMFGCGFFFSTQVDLWPNRDFSLFVLGYKRDLERAQLRSPEAEYSRAVRKADGAKDDDEPGDGEGWSCWVSPFNLGLHQKILTQELAQKAD